MSEILKASHEGKITIGEIELNCAVLNDGTRVLSQNAVLKAFGREKRGIRRITDGGIKVPPFMDANNLEPFISKDLWGAINLIEFNDLNGKSSSGYNADILPLVCELYLSARDAKNILTKSQLVVAKSAEIIVRSLSRVAIVALIDEATGYQYDRERYELQKILTKYISNELLAWQKTFPDAYYIEIFRLNGWGYTVSDIKKRPSVIGKWTNKIIYEQLPKGVLSELKSKTPKSETGNYTARFFQSLTMDTGHPHLTAQINQIIAIMRISDNWKQFITNFNKMVDRKNGQLELKFDDLEYKGEPKEEKLSDFNSKLNTALNFKPKDKE